MSDPKFNEGDEILVVEGEFKGRHGTVLRFEAIFETYMVTLPELSLTGYFACRESELELLDESSDDDAVDEIDVPSFGMTSEQFTSHLEYLFTRSLEHVSSVGPEQAFFGFQEFEGKSAADQLVALMLKLEEGMAMFAQAHILIGRTVVALESVNDQIK